MATTNSEPLRAHLLPRWISEAYGSAGRHRSQAVDAWSSLIGLAETISEYLLLQAMALLVEDRRSSGTDAVVSGELVRRLHKELTIGDKVAVVQLALQESALVQKHLGRIRSRDFSGAHPISASVAFLNGVDHGGRKVSVLELLQAFVPFRNQTFHSRLQLTESTSKAKVPVVRDALDAALVQAGSILGLPLLYVRDATPVPRGVELCLCGTTAAPDRDFLQTTAPRPEISRDTLAFQDPEAPGALVPVPKWLASYADDHLSIFDGLSGPREFRYKERAPASDRRAAGAELYRTAVAEVPFIFGREVPPEPWDEESRWRRLQGVIDRCLQGDGVLDRTELAALHLAAEVLEVEDRWKSALEGLPVAGEDAQPAPGQQATSHVLELGALPDYWIKKALTAVDGLGAVYRSVEKCLEFPSEVERSKAVERLIAAEVILPPDVLGARLASLTAHLDSARRWLNKGEILSAIQMTPVEWEIVRRDGRASGAIKSVGSAGSMRYGLPDWSEPTGEDAEDEDDEGADTDDSEETEEAEVDESGEDGQVGDRPTWTGIGNFSLSQVKRLGLAYYLRILLGHTDLRRINSRLGKHHGNTLVRSLFEWEPDAEQALLSGATRWRLEELRAQPVLAAMLGLGVDEVQARLDLFHGRTLVRTIFPEIG
jgi:hypothetical protein